MEDFEAAIALVNSRKEKIEAAKPSKWEAIQEKVGLWILVAIPTYYFVLLLMHE